MRKSVHFLVLAVALVCFMQTKLAAQVSLTWEEAGPNNVGNHVRSIAVDGSGGVWAGSVGGGLWKSSDRGSSWSRVAGISDNLAVTTIAADGNRIFVGTGEGLAIEPPTTMVSPWSVDSITTFRYGYFTFAGQPGEGVFVSTDGGATFTHNNATWGPSSVPFAGPFKSIQKVAINGNRVFVAALDGLYYSDNNLATVTKSTSAATNFTTQPIVDVAVLANNVILAATKDSIYRSTDNGVTFGRRINSVIFPNTTTQNPVIGGKKILFAVAPSNNNVVYVTGASGINSNCTGIWKSTDAGVTWTRIGPFESSNFTPFRGNGQYASCIAVQANDPDAVVIGGARMYKYTNTTGWVTVGSSLYIPGFSTNYVPTPQLCIGLDLTTDSSYFVGTDAEVVRTDNFGRNFSFKTKALNAAHLHGIDGSVEYELLASDRYNGVLYRDNANSNVLNQQFFGFTTTSRGGIARWSPTLLDVMVSQGTDGGVQRSLNGGEAWESFYGVPLEPFHPSIIGQDSIYIDRQDSLSSGGTLYDVGGTPIVPWCFDGYIPAANLNNDTSIANTPAYLYMCSKNFIWACTNPYGGIDSLPHWNRISNDFTRNDIVPTGALQKEFYTAITCTNDATHTVFAATNGGRVIRIIGANDPTTLDVNTVPVQIQDASMPERWITDIAVDPNNNNIVVVTFGGYPLGDDRVWITNNAMSATPTWRSAQGNLPADVPVYSAAFSNNAGSRLLLIGTEYGIYATGIDYTNTGTSFTWNDVGGGVVEGQVTDIVFRRYNIVRLDGDNYKYDADNTILIATNGRGAFKSLTAVSRPEENFDYSGIKVTLGPNPTAAQSTLRMELPSVTKVTVHVYDVQGHLVAAMPERVCQAGMMEYEMNASILPSGVYIVKSFFSNSKGSFQHSIRQVVQK